MFMFHVLFHVDSEHVSVCEPPGLLGVKNAFRISIFVSVCRFDSKSQDSPFRSPRAKENPSQAAKKSTDSIISDDRRVGKTFVFDKKIQEFFTAELSNIYLRRDFTVSARGEEKSVRH